ncbi:MAG: hypothetical protein Q4A37_00080 [Candidatus Saccharibacteria bacterium]|nr:hypothetical protein [Candidatus Saccharibacteria bacterium]
MKRRATMFQDEATDYTYALSRATAVRLLVTSMVAGAAMWLLGVMLDKLLLSQMFCSGATDGVYLCMHSTMIGGYIALVLVSVMLVPMLVMTGIRRPLLVAVAAAAALWGVTAWTAGAWVLSLLLTMLAVVMACMALVWINRIRGNGAALLLMAVFVVLARVVIAL